MAPTAIATLVPNEFRYRHGVIQNLINSALLRKVRTEIQNLSFTPKETDIYKIHQSGDLANLDGLDDSSLKLLPSLLTLRNALYSSDFRKYLSHITGSGPLSGGKTDMAINVYTPGCHLLCHDDVIGSRRVSYILYLTDPDRPWKKDWGGALRLYPTQVHEDSDGRAIKVPSPDYRVAIPPAFNQLSFFAVQPGESFHDVEEVYEQTGNSNEGEADSRVRMAISGWYHVPQKGEDGYEEGLEEQLAEKSSLMQLQGKCDAYDMPKPKVQSYAAENADDGLAIPFSYKDTSLSSEDIDFLLKYLAPTYLTPDPLKEISTIFADECSICLEAFLSRRFSTSVRDYIQAQETQPLPQKSSEIEEKTSWSVARPPHKQRYLFQQDGAAQLELSHLQDILSNLIPSKAFQKWLFIATGHQIISHDSCVRRFRRGQDYTLATSYQGDSPRIELCLSVTPTPGLGDDPAMKQDQDTKDRPNADNPGDLETDTDSSDDPGTGGYLAYMAGDEDEGEAANNETGSDHGVEVPLDMSTGARATRVATPRKPKQDPAIYQANAEDEDDGVLFSMPASWNKLAIVLRDKGTMRFVKYVSAMAKRDRWDVVGEFEIVDEEGESEGNGSDATTDRLEEDGGNEAYDDDDDEESD